MEETPSNQPKTSPDRMTVVLRWVVGIVVALAVLLVGWYAYAYLATPKPLQHPSEAHFHFRMQVINGGKAVNFAEDKFQTEFNKDICTADLTKQPIHFHDKLDQFVHIHWKGITGGLLLKNYGWNFIGGTKYTLGYRFDHLPKLTRVPVHGLDLPKQPAGVHYYIYTGDATGYRQRDWSDFLKSDLEDFFAGKKPTSWIDGLVPAAYAHGDAAHEAELTKLNHVAGNVVIFAQTEQPSPGEITGRFAKLIDLPESACGG